MRGKGGRKKLSRRPGEGGSRGCLQRKKILRSRAVGDTGVAERAWGWRKPSQAGERGATLRTEEGRQARAKNIRKAWNESKKIVGDQLPRCEIGHVSRGDKGGRGDINDTLKLLKRTNGLKKRSRGAKGTNIIEKGRSSLGFIGRGLSERSLLEKV